MPKNISMPGNFNSDQWRVSVTDSLDQVDEAEWNALGDTDYPFTRHSFLHGLERHDCLEPFGWHPVYFLVHRGANLIAAVPCYLKTNSYGELVFDHAWVNAYHRSGLDYYPKLVTAIPYTPATGPRFLLHPESAAPIHRRPGRDFCCTRNPLPMTKPGKRCMTCFAAQSKRFATTTN
jgi:predicted N-acyltransferase